MSSRSPTETKNKNTGWKWAALLGLTGTVCLGLTAGAYLLFRKPAVPKEKLRQRLSQALDANPKSIFAYDPVLSYRLKPSFRGWRHDQEGMEHQTNSLGLLGKEEPDPERERWLFLGDSVLYGEHVPAEKIFSALLAQNLGKNVQVLNAGCPGWSTHQELSFFRNHLSGLNPALTVVVFCLNDLLRFEWVWRDGESFRISEEVGGLGGLLASHCRSLELILLRRWLRSNAGLEALADLNNTCLTAWLSSNWSSFSKRTVPLLNSLPEPVIFLAVPARAQIEAFRDGGNPEIILTPQHKLAEFCRDHNLGFIDAREAFRDGEAWRTDFYLRGERGELHLSPAGHRALARFLNDILPRPDGGESKLTPE